MLKPLGNYAKGENLSFGYRFQRAYAVSEDTWQFQHFRQPTAVRFLLLLYGEIHLVPQFNSANGLILLRNGRPPPTNERGFPLMNPTMYDTACFGGMLMHRCT